MTGLAGYLEFPEDMEGAIEMNDAPHSLPSRADDESSRGWRLSWRDVVTIVLVAFSTGIAHWIIDESRADGLRAGAAAVLAGAFACILVRQTRPVRPTDETRVETAPRPEPPPARRRWVRYALLALILIALFLVQSREESYLHALVFVLWLASLVVIPLIVRPWSADADPRATT